MGSDMEEIHGITEDPEEDLIPYVGPPKLLPIPLKAVDEDENIIESFDCKLYRLSGGEWKQRGQGVLKFLRHKETQVTRIVMFESKIFHLRANHKLSKEDNLCDLIVSPLHEFAYEWKCKDNTAGQIIECFLVKLKTQEEFELFSKVFNNSFLDD